MESVFSARDVEKAECGDLESALSRCSLTGGNH